jgi:hypothetical protein
MITEIYLEGNRLDLFQELGAELNYVIDDIKDFSSRNTSYSKTITIPGNANNNKIFGHIYDFNSGNNYGNDSNATNVGYDFNASKRAACIIYHNKIQIFKGIIRLLEIVIDAGKIEYQCAVFGELGGFSSAIGNSLIEDLTGFEAYNISWNKTNIVNSWNASGGTGIVFPLVDYGQCKNTAPDYHIDAFRPAFFVYELLTKIISNSGYTFESSFLNTTFFKSLIIPNNKANLEQIITKLLEANSRTFIYSGTNSKVTFETGTLYEFTLSGGNTYIYNGTSASTGTTSLYGNGYLTSTNTVKLQVCKNNTSTVIAEQIYPSTGGVRNTFYVSLPGNVTLATNDTLFVYVTSANSFTFEASNLSFNYISNSKTAVKSIIDDTLVMNDLLPKGILQKDFFISICRMFNLYIWEDANESKKLYIEPYIDFYQINGGNLRINDFGESLLHGEPGDLTGLLLLSDPTVDSLDWNKKLDYSRPMTLKPMSELNSRFYYFSFKDDDDFYTEAYKKKYSYNYGDRYEDTGFEFATEEHKIETIFSPGLLTGRSGDDKLAISVFKVNNTTEERKDHNIRIAQFKKVTGVSSYHINKEYPNNGNATPTTALTSYGYAGHLNDPVAPTTDINFGVPKEILFTISNYPTTNLYTSFWTDYLGEITGKDSKLLTCYLYLTLEDIYNIDFSKLIYLNGSLWRLNKVEDFNPSLSLTTRVELLKVLETTYAG